METPNKNRRVGQNKSPIVAALPRACADETAAVEFMEARRGWDAHPECPRCGSANVYKMTDGATGKRNARFLWRCKGECRMQFTVRIGTVFEDSRIPLSHWCYGFWAAAAGKKGVSAMQIQRQTGLSYKSALFMMHRIRWAMSEPDAAPIGGYGKTVEADETYVGGKPRRGQNAHNKRGRGTSKTPVMAMVERGGDLRYRVMERVTIQTLGAALMQNVDPSGRLMTDGLRDYQVPGRLFYGGHESVNHTAGEYARGEAHNNTAESAFSLLKRGMYGTFHSVSKKHLHRYCDEFAFKWNTRTMDDGARVARAVKMAEGKRLMYRDPA